MWLPIKIVTGGVFQMMSSSGSMVTFDPSAADYDWMPWKSGYVGSVDQCVVSDVGKI